MKRNLWPIILVFLASCASPEQLTTVAEVQTPPTAALPSTTPLTTVIETQAPQEAESPSPLSPTPTQSPVPTSTPNYVSTMTALGPMIDVTFDGEQCSVSGPTELTLGDHVIKYNNLSGQFSAPEVAWLYPGKTYKDLQEFIGAPGSYCDRAPSWYAIVRYTRSIAPDSTSELRQFKFDRESVYTIVASTGDDHFWPCGHFLVKAIP